MITPKLARAIGEAAYKAGIGKGDAAELTQQLAKSEGWSSAQRLPKSETLVAYERIQRDNEGGQGHG